MAPVHGDQSRARTTRLGVGLAAVGRPAYINLGRVPDLPPRRDVDTMRRHAHHILDMAYAAGIRWVDAARSYGRAEEFLGGWLHERGHADVTVSSKWGYTYVGDWSLEADTHEVKEHSLASFERQLAESVRELSDAISVYQVHSLTKDSPLFTDNALLDALAALGAGGIEVGFSTSGPRQADTACARRSSSKWPVKPCSPPCSRLGTCWSQRSAPPWRPHTPRVCTSSSRSHWRTASL